MQYVNQRYCFQLDFPDPWRKSRGLERMSVWLADVINHAGILEEFTDGNKQFINIVMETMQPEIPPDITAMLFQTQALDLGYTEIEVGTFEVEQREHAWATYVMNRKGWLKKYMIIVNGLGYALTASCPIEQRSREVEDRWDRIAASFQLTVPLDRDVLALNASFQTRMAIAALREDAMRELERRRRRAIR